jgi:hypothetical protein
MNQPPRRRLGLHRALWLVTGLTALSVGCLGLARTGFASAQQARNLRIVTPGGEQANASFPMGTRQVEVKFDYLDASQTSMAFVVYGPGGLRLMRHEALYDGDGTASIQVTGRDLMEGLGAGLVSNTQELQRAAAQASNAQRAVREYMNVVESALLLVRTAEELGTRSHLPAAALQKLAVLTAARSQLSELAARARLLDDSDDAGLRAIAQQMSAPAAAAVAGAQGFETAVKGLELFLIPTGNSMSESAAYVLTVMVDGQPADSALMWVMDPIYLPFNSMPR